MFSANFPMPCFFLLNILYYFKLLRKTSTSQIRSMLHLVPTAQVLTPVENLANPVSTVSQAATPPVSATAQTPPQESSETIMTIRTQSCSTMNFAVRLLRSKIPGEELHGKNINGLRGKNKVDPAVVENIRRLVFEHYPCAPSGREKMWTDCRKAMDCYIMKLKRSAE